MNKSTFSHQGPSRCHLRSNYIPGTSYCRSCQPLRPRYWFCGTACWSLSWWSPRIMISVIILRLHSDYLQKECVCPVLLFLVEVPIGEEPEHAKLKYLCRRDVRQWTPLVDSHHRLAVVMTDNILSLLGEINPLQRLTT